MPTRTTTRTECHHKVEKFHGVVSLSLGFLSIPSDHGLDLERVRKRGSAETWRSLWGCSFFRSGKCSCKTCTRLADRQVSGGLRRKKSNGKNGNKRKNGRRNGVQNLIMAVFSEQAKRAQETCAKRAVCIRFMVLRMVRSPFCGVFSEIVQAYHRRAHFSRENCAREKTLYHTTKFCGAREKRLCDSHAAFPAFSVSFSASSTLHLPLWAAARVCRKIGQLPGAAQLVGTSAGLSIPERKPVHYTDLTDKNPEFYKRKDGFYDAHR